MAILSLGQTKNRWHLKVESKQTRPRWWLSFNPFEQSDRQIGSISPQESMVKNAKKVVKPPGLKTWFLDVPGWFWIPLQDLSFAATAPPSVLCLNFAPGRLAGKSWLMMEKSWLHFGCWNERFYIKQLFFCWKPVEEYAPQMKHIFCAKEG